MLKKQTIWLLTMLSLMVVLSVYYVMSPKSGDLAYINKGESDAEKTASSEQMDDGDAKVDGITNAGKDEVFANIRMNLQDKRSMEKSRLNDIVASSSASTEEKNKAWEEINTIEGIESKEYVLENSIMSQGEYEEVLVRSEDNIVHVHLKTNTKPSGEEVVNIMQLVRDEFGDIPVDVDYQPSTDE